MRLLREVRTRKFDYHSTSVLAGRHRAIRESEPRGQAQGRTGSQAGSCEGRRSHREMNPELVVLVKRLRRRHPKTGERRSFRAIAAELAARGHFNIHGRPFAAESIKAMVQR
jgi:hypothetical protein